MLHILSLGVLLFCAGFILFHTRPLSASVVNIQNQDNNSQRLTLLSPRYAVEIPDAEGGPSDIRVNNKLSLLSPQIGVVTGNTSILRVEVDPDGVIVYVVQEGDTLSEIAENFDVSINTIKWENNFNTAIKPGQELRILPLTGVRHIIQKGDTFGKIAHIYGVEIEDITIFNDIDETKLIPSKKIIIPNGVKQKNVRTTTSKRSNVSSIKSPDGYYIRPAGGRISSRFGPRKRNYHYGIDYAAPIGSPIAAAASGIVIKTSCGRGYGKCLVVAHDNGTQTLYAHASKIYVNKGTKVKQGQKIAAIGSTGRSTGPHLHFEIIESNGKKRNVNFLK